MHPIDLAVVLAYAALITFVGIRISQQIKTAKDYFLAGRSLAWWVIGLSIIGTNVDTNGYIGASGNAYSIGIAQANFEWIGAIPAMIIASLIFIPLYWRAGVYSIAEYLGLRYNQAVHVVAALIVTTVSVFAMGSPCGLGHNAGNLHGLADLAWHFGVGNRGRPVQYCRQSRCCGYHGQHSGLHHVRLRFNHRSHRYQRCRGYRLVSKLTAANPTHLSAYLPADHESYPWHGVILGLGLVCRRLTGWVGQYLAAYSGGQKSVGCQRRHDVRSSRQDLCAAAHRLSRPAGLSDDGRNRLPGYGLTLGHKRSARWRLGLMFVAIIAAQSHQLTPALTPRP